MSEFEFGQGIEFLVLCAAQLYSRTLNAALAPYGITLRQAQVILWLAYEGKPLPQQALAARMHLEPPTLVGILDRMARDGWISRQDCPGDRRKKMIRLEPSVEKIWPKITSAAHAVRAQATKGMTKAEITQVNKLLEAYELNLMAANPELMVDLAVPEKPSKLAAGG
jgi:MarR family transcriptional regulator, transcriptional regulator for hemolysin